MAWTGKAGPNVEADIAAREASLTGKPLRVKPPKQNEVPKDLRQFYAESSKAFGAPDVDPNADLSTLYLQMAVHPELARHSLGMTVQLCVNGVLPGRDRELTILRVLWMCGSPSPFGEHVFTAKMEGVTTEEIHMVREGSTAKGWNEHDRAMLKAAEQLVSKYVVDDTTWKTLSKNWTDAQKHEFAILVGQYVTSAIYHNAMRTRCSSYNKGLAQD